MAAALVMGWLGACARQEAPPGGPEDLRPPVVVRTVPEAFATVDEIEEVRFEFDERISERVSGGSLDEAVSISPRGGEIDVGHGRRSLTVRPQGGFRPGLVYRVTLRPVVSDLFGNRLTDPFELVFSTGGDPVPTTIAGEVWDRINGQGSGDITVYATGLDSLVHESSTDADGIFALRYLPAGDVALVAFEDRNRNGEVDSTEVQGMTNASLGPGDTLFVDLAILAPDTTPAVLADAEAVDSVTVALEFDDHLATDMDADAVGVTLARGEDGGGAGPGVVRLWLEAEYAAFVEAVADSFARLDSIDAAERAAAEAAIEVETDSAVVDSIDRAEPDVAGVVTDSAGTTVPDSAARAPETPESGAGVADSASVAPGRIPPTRLAPLPGSSPGPTEDGRRVLPGRRIVVLLDAPLPVEVPFTIEASGVVNINGLGAGGGSTELVREPPDSATVEDGSPDTGPDALALPPDSAGIPPDTIGPPPDTGTARSDTTSAPRAARQGGRR